MIDSELSRRMKAFYVDGGHLLKLHMDLLYACDLDCKHCYLDDKSRPQVSTEAIIDVLKQGAELGAMQVLFSGGEIFLRPDFLELLKHACGHGFASTLKTHAGNITPEIAALSDSLRTLADLPNTNALLGYNTEVGPEVHRRAGAAWLTRPGWAVAADDIIIMGGAQLALLSAMMSFTRADDPVLLEQLTYSQLIDEVHFAQRRAVSVTLDGGGAARRPGCGLPGQRGEVAVRDAHLAEPHQCRDVPGSAAGDC